VRFESKNSFLHFEKRSSLLQKEGVSLVRFEIKNSFLHFEKRSSLLQRWRSCKFTIANNKCTIPAL
jgi:hypothetical protein